MNEQGSFEKAVRKEGEGIAAEMEATFSVVPDGEQFSFSNNPWAEELTKPARKLLYSNDYGLDGRVDETLQGGLGAPGGSAVVGTSPSLRSWGRAFEETVGVPVQFFRVNAGQVGTEGFVSPSNPTVLFANADSEVPVGSILAHEWAHLAEFDPDKKALLFGFFPRIAALLNREVLERKRDALAGLYRSDKAPKEVLFNLLSDALTGLDYWSSSEAATSPEAWQEVRREAENLFSSLNPLNPVPYGKGESSELIRSESTFSVIPTDGNLENVFVKMFSPFHRSPELRSRFGHRLEIDPTRFSHE